MSRLLLCLALRESGTRRYSRLRIASCVLVFVYAEKKISFDKNPTSQKFILGKRQVFPAHALVTKVTRHSSLADFIRNFAVLKMIFHLLLFKLWKGAYLLIIHRPSHRENRVAQALMPPFRRMN